MLYWSCMEIRPTFNDESALPIYRQLGSYLHALIENGQLHPGDRLPPTRELAGQLGLNRTTVSAAYDLLETEGLIRGHVGRGSFVEGPPEQPRATEKLADTEKLDWESLIPA